jgi:phosphoribosyl 1,2-cyclic phosphate phosphodiesterase
VPEIQINQIDMDSFSVGDITVTPILVWHMRMPVLGFRFGNFTYITDANRIDPDEMDKIRGSSHLVLNALRHEKHISHFTLSEAVAVVQELKVPNAYFTHISHQLGLHELINASLPAGIQLAYDGLSIQV